MAKTIKAERATILLGDIPIEVYQLPDGSYKLSGRNVTDAVSEANNTLIRYYGVKSLKDLSDTDEPLIYAGKEGSPCSPISTKCALKYWGNRAALGNTLAEQLLAALKEDPSILGVTIADVPVFVGSKRKKRISPETVIQSQLIRKYGGNSEVMCLAGRIDVLTSTELIEIKNVKDWKDAIGQVLVYSCYYPSHGKRIHFFGNAHTSTRSLIESHCHKLDISVTWD